MQKLSWAVLLVSYRRARQLTQDQLAQALKVSTATVSRWESGRQVPSVMQAAKLDALIGLHRLNQTEEWIYRTDQTAGYKALLRPGGAIAAVSDGLLALFGLARESAIERRLWNFLGLDAEVAAQAAISKTVRRGEGIGFFSGRVRHIKFVADMRRGDMALTDVKRGDIPAGGVIQRWAVDVWPLLTAQDDLFAHVTLMPMGPAPEADWEGRYRLVSFRLTPLVRAEGFEEAGRNYRAAKG